MSSNIRIKRICIQCNSEFTAKTTVTKYCSAKCAKRAYKARKRDEKIKTAEGEITQRGIQSIEQIKNKEVLNIKEVSFLTGVSKRTIYRLIEQGKINKIKIGSRTLIKRTEIDRLFETNTKTNEPKAIKALDVTKCYTIGEIQQKFSISESTLYTILNREKIQKMQRGKYVYVQRQDIDKLLSYEKS